MIIHLQTPPFRACLLVILGSLLAACGSDNGAEPSVDDIRVERLQYSQTAVITIGGRNLRSSIVTDTGGGCTNPRYAASSTPELMVLNCLVARVGEIPLTLRSDQGAQLYSTTLTVPKPQVAMTTSEGGFTMELDPAVAPITVDNFLEYVNVSFYRKTLFHRVITGFVIEGGATPRAS